MPMAPLLPSLSQSSPIASWKVPYNQLIEQEKTLTWFKNCAARDAGTTRKWMISALSGTSLKNSREGKSSQWADS